MIQKIRRRHWGLDVLLFVLSLVSARLSPTASAQSDTTGGLGGQIVDPSGGAIGAARVTIVYVATGFRRTVQSDGEGHFSFPHVQPGLYRVDAEAPAFERVEQSVTVPLGRTEAVT